LEKGQDAKTEKVSQAGPWFPSILPWFPSILPSIHVHVLKAKTEGKQYCVKSEKAMEEMDKELSSKRKARTKA
jgi:hypothetical protein